MRSKNYLILLAVTFMQLSCANEPEEGDLLTRTLVLSDSLNIYLPDTIPHLGSLTRPLYSTTDNAFSYASEDGTFVNIYSYVKDSALWKLTSLNKNGVNQVYGNGAFNLSNNEITFLPFNTPKVLRLNQNGLKLWEKSYFPNREMAFDSKVKNPIIHDDGQNIFFDLGSYVDFNDKRTFKKTQTIGKYDYNNDRFYPLIDYPEEFHNRTWSGNDAEHQLIIRGELIYMNFVKSEFIYMHDKNGNLIKKKAIKSHHIKNSRGKKTDDSMQNAIQQLNNGYYPRLIYDQWRDVFYRIGVYFDVDYEIKSAQEIARAFRKKKLVILTFDKDLNLLAQDEFNAMNNRLNEYYHWMSEDGLYLYQTPLKRAENNYQFAKFSLTKR